VPDTAALGKELKKNKKNIYRVLARLTLGKAAVTGAGVVTTTFLYRVLASLALGKAFAECPIKDTRQRHLCRPKFYRGLFAECGTRQSFCRVQNGLCRVPLALGKEPDSSSVYGMNATVAWHVSVMSRGQQKGDTSWCSGGWWVYQEGGRCGHWRGHQQWGAQIAAVARLKEQQWEGQTVVAAQLKETLLLGPCLVPKSNPQIPLCKKEIPHHIKMSANAWSTKCRWNKKLIAQFCCTLRDEHFESNLSFFGQFFALKNKSCYSVPTRALYLQCPESGAQIRELNKA
jgi:hypothetical protein